jgi:hypothetical protein
MLKNISAPAFSRKRQTSAGGWSSNTVISPKEEAEEAEREHAPPPEPDLE